MSEKSITIGLNLRVARVREQLTQRQFAEKMTAAGIKCSVDSISKIERGERVVNKDFITTAAKILNCTPRDLKSVQTAQKTPALKLVAALRNTADLMEQVYQNSKERKQLL